MWSIFWENWFSIGTWFSPPPTTPSARFAAVFLAFLVLFPLPVTFFFSRKAKMTSWWFFYVSIPMIHRKPSLIPLLSSMFNNFHSPFPCPQYRVASQDHVTRLTSLSPFIGFPSPPPRRGPDPRCNFKQRTTKAAKTILAFAAIFGCYVVGPKRNTAVSCPYYFGLYCGLLRETASQYTRVARL